MCSGRTWFCLLCCRVTPKHSLIEAGAVQTSSSSGALEKVMEMGGRDWRTVVSRCGLPMWSSDVVFRCGFMFAVEHVMIGKGVLFMFSSFCSSLWVPVVN